MKKYLLLSLLMIYKVSSAQTDTLVNTLVLEQLAGGIEYMKTNLGKSHQEFQLGSTMVIIGAASIVAGSLLPDEVSQTSSGEVSSPNSLEKPLIIGGSVLSLIGGIIMIDSHKYIGRAGRWRFDGNKLLVNF